MGELGTQIVFLRSVLQLIVTANIVLGSRIFVTLMKEATHSSETSVLTRSTWRYIPGEDVNSFYLSFLSYFFLSSFLPSFILDRLCGLVVRVPGC
jgi:hypothetical protein